MLSLILLITKVILRSYFFYEYYSIIVVLSSVFLFLAFLSIKIKGKKEYLVKISSYVFVVYLIHEHPSLRKVLWDTITPFKYSDSVVFIPHMIVSCILVFFISIFIGYSIEQVIARMLKVKLFLAGTNKLKNYLILLFKKVTPFLN
jgi:surface polysaccharide O-acyltransferase-like enzyme